MLRSIANLYWIWPVVWRRRPSSWWRTWRKEGRHWGCMARWTLSAWSQTRTCCSCLSIVKHFSLKDGFDLKLVQTSLNLKIVSPQNDSIILINNLLYLSYKKYSSPFYKVKFGSKNSSSQTVKCTEGRKKKKLIVKAFDSTLSEFRVRKYWCKIFKFPFKAFPSESLLWVLSSYM